MRTDFPAGMKPSAAVRHGYRYYDFVMAAFVTVLICSNLIGPAKIAQVEVPLLGALTFGAGVLFFPISYVFGDILRSGYRFQSIYAQGVSAATTRPAFPLMGRRIFSVLHL